ncbi:MAG: FHA domain-containing protein [Muribaculaceae bacterium]|nr:FHA domain-containing protein [Muribaculaceae bacterium]
MSQTPTVKFNCLNPECGKLLEIPVPKKTGVYNVTCPFCKTQKQLRFKGLDEMEAQKKQAPQRPDYSAAAPVEMEEDFKIGNKYSFKCPHCQKQEIGFQTDKAGHRQIACPYCKGKIGFTVWPKTQVIIVTEQLQLNKGKLVLLKRGWLNKDYPLKEGQNIVGRFDESGMSDISIKNDPSMSRRSIDINVKRTEKGYEFKLNVLKSTNPVLHNNVPLKTSDSVSLNFGDTIVLGKTKFRFDKVVEKKK